MKVVEGYKVFNPDWTCKGFQYEVGKVFEENVIPSCCNRGFHFCKELSDCFSYYPFNPDNKVAKVIALGKVDEDSDDSKCCTNKIQIVEEISWKEALRMVNLGKGNASNYNSGSRNSGDYNSGYYNTGNRNSGNFNSGNNNSGNYNSGSYNTGNRNSGNNNSGNQNSGDWNKTRFSNGCFNTEEPKICLFNKPSEWTRWDWLHSDAKRLLDEIPRSVEWVWSNNMTDEEKESHPEYKTIGGYLETVDNPKYAQLWWDELSKDEKNIIKSIPNFDKDIFKEITGIEV